MFIVYYHNVVDTRTDRFDDRCSRLHVREFERQIRLLVERLRPIALPDLVRRLADGVADPLRIAVTFDDGYRSVARHALPILRRHGVPATIFAVTDAVPEAGPSRLLHFDEIEVAFRLTTATRVEFAFCDGVFELDDLELRVGAMKEVKKTLKLAEAEDRDRWREHLFEQLGVSPRACLEAAAGQEKYQLSNWAELRELVRDGVTIGAHTRSHPTLSQIGEDDLYSELSGSLQALSSRLGLREVPFAYPYGRPEHIGSEAPVVARRVGFSCGLTTVSGSNQPGTDTFSLHRSTFGELAALAAERSA